MGLFQKKRQNDNIEHIRQRNTGSIFKTIGIVFAVLLILLLAFVALYFRKRPIFCNPAYIDTVFIAMPFFVLGNEVKALGALPKNARYDRWGLAVIVPVMVMLYFNAGAKRAAVL